MRVPCLYGENFDPGMFCQSPTSTKRDDCTLPALKQNGRPLGVSGNIGGSDGDSVNQEKDVSKELPGQYMRQGNEGSSETDVPRL